jgi:hypothetical protein
MLKLRDERRARRVGFESERGESGREQGGPLIGVLVAGEPVHPVEHACPDGGGGRIRGDQQIESGREDLAVFCRDRHEIFPSPSKFSMFNLEQG